MSTQIDIGFAGPKGRAGADAAKGQAAAADKPAPGGRKDAARQDAARQDAVRRDRRRGRLSPLTRRILAVNVLAIAIPIAGLLYLDEYRNDMVAAELEALRTEGELIAGALGTSGVVVGPFGEERLLPETTRVTVRRLVQTAEKRARLFDRDGALLADSFRLAGPGGQVEIEILQPLAPKASLSAFLTDVYDWIVDLLPDRRALPVYHEPLQQHGTDYPVVMRALGGEVAKAVYDDGAGGMILTVAVPVQRYKQVLGALLLSTTGQEIAESVRTIRFEILKVFGVALAVTVLLSIYLAGTIARPIYRLADAADRVRRGKGWQTTIPDFTRRGDEIGDLSAALREMTEALWQRIDAIDRFAADVAHEIKNPLTSLRSAVETAARIDDPAQQRKLMSIILDDVQRLDRLITDISEASRLDAELSRGEVGPVDLGQVLATLVDVHAATSGDQGPRLELDVATHQDLEVNGIEGRLVQVLRNLISNAISFSPPGGVIRLGAVREGNVVRVTVTDEGPGIPPDKLVAIFDRFYSERPAGEKFGTHSGLGLSISKQIVEAYGGTIAAENRKDASGRIIGAQFTVSLPAR